MAQMRQLSQLLACCHVFKWDSKISNRLCLADGNMFAVLVVNRGYLEVNLYSFLPPVPLAHCGEKQLSLFPLNTKLLDEGWIDHGNVRARFDQTVSSRLSSIIADNPRGDDLQENLAGFNYGCSSTCARGGTLDTRQGCCNGWDVGDFGVVCFMISISSGRTWLVKQCVVRLSTSRYFTSYG